VVYHAPLATSTTTLSTCFCRRGSPVGTLTGIRSASTISLSFLTTEFARLHNRGTQTTWLMILRSLVRYLSREGHVPRGWDAALPSIATRKHISLPRGLSREQVRALWSASEGRRPATSVTGHYCCFSCVSGFVPRRSPTAHLQTSIGGLGA